MALVELIPAPFRRWYATEHGRKMTRYAMVSVVAVPTGEVGIVIGLHVLALTAGWASVFGNSLGAIPSYYLNRSWVWGKGGRSHLLKEILPFWGITIVGVIFGGWFGHIGGVYARHHHIVGSGRTVLLLAANLLAFAILWVVKYVFFNKVLFVVKHHHDATHPTHDQQSEAGFAGAAGAPELS
jgi:putative flippase GtrA